MKHFTAVPFPLVILLMLVYPRANAQDYVLTTRGDSLVGEVKPLHYGPEKKVQIVSGDKEKQNLSLFEVREFSSDGDIYHPVKGETGYLFMKLLQPGYLSLYAYQLENQTRFDGLFLKKADGEGMVVPNLGFRKYVSQFLEDCPKVSERVKDGDLNKKNLTDVINAYNTCIANRTVDHHEVIAQREEQTEKINAWDSLEEKIKGMEFTEKNNALEMIAEIKKKIARQESIPNFLVEGLKNALKATGLETDLEEALAEASDQ